MKYFIFLVSLPLPQKCQRCFMKCLTAGEDLHGKSEWREESSKKTSLGREFSKQNIPYGRFERANSSNDIGKYYRCRMPSGSRESLFGKGFKARRRGPRGQKGARHVLSWVVLSIGRRGRTKSIARGGNEFFRNHFVRSNGQREKPF